MSNRKEHPRRYWTVFQSVGIGLLVAAVVALGLVATAGATVNSGDIVPTAAQATGTFTASAPFDSGQNINVVIPANAAFASPDNSTAKKIVECAAPNGVVPTLTTACDGLTVQGRDPSWPPPTVHFTLTGYTVYALPDLVSLSEGPGGPGCGATAATECILYIGDDYNDFTKPHLWSSPFFISPNGNDLGANPGDGTAPAVASVPDQTNSTVAASPATVTADGVNSSTVTVTLLDAKSTPVQGKTVTLTPACTPTPCSTHITGPSPATTDGNGQTTFTVTDTAAQSVTVTAADPADSVTVTQTASITFQAPTTSAANSTVSANPTNPPADGTTKTTITVTVRDQGAIPQPIAGDTVTLAQGSRTCDHHAGRHPQHDERAGRRHLHGDRYDHRDGDVHGDGHDEQHGALQHGRGDVRQPRRFCRAVHRHRSDAGSGRPDSHDSRGHPAHVDQRSRGGEGGQSPGELGDGRRRRTVSGDDRLEWPGVLPHHRLRCGARHVDGNGHHGRVPTHTEAHRDLRGVLPVGHGFHHRGIGNDVSGGR